MLKASVAVEALREDKCLCTSVLNRCNLSSRKTNSPAARSTASKSFKRRNAGGDSFAETPANRTHPDQRIGVGKELREKYVNEKEPNEKKVVTSKVSNIPSEIDTKKKGLAAVSGKVITPGKVQESKIDINLNKKGFSSEKAVPVPSSSSGVAPNINLASTTHRIPLRISSGDLDKTSIQGNLSKPAATHKNVPGTKIASNLQDVAASKKSHPKEKYEKPSKADSHPQSSYEVIKNSTHHQATPNRPSNAKIASQPQPAVIKNKATPSELDTMPAKALSDIHFPPKNTASNSKVNPKLDDGISNTTHTILKDTAPVSPVADKVPLTQKKLNEVSNSGLKQHLKNANRGSLDSVKSPSGRTEYENGKQVARYHNPRVQSVLHTNMVDNKKHFPIVASGHIFGDVADLHHSGQHRPEKLQHQDVSIPNTLKKPEIQTSSLSNLHSDHYIRNNPASFNLKAAKESAPVTSDLETTRKGSIEGSGKQEGPDISSNFHRRVMNPTKYLSIPNNIHDTRPFSVGGQLADKFVQRLGQNRLKYGKGAGDSSILTPDFRKQEGSIEGNDKTKGPEISGDIHALPKLSVVNDIATMRPFLDEEEEVIKQINTNKESGFSVNVDTMSPTLIPTKSMGVVSDSSTTKPFSAKTLVPKVSNDNYVTPNTARDEHMLTRYENGGLGDQLSNIPDTSDNSDGQTSNINPDHRVAPSSLDISTTPNAIMKTQGALSNSNIGLSKIDDNIPKITDTLVKDTTSVGLTPGKLNTQASRLETKPNEANNGELNQDFTAREADAESNVKSSFNNSAEKNGEHVDAVSSIFDNKDNFPVAATKDLLGSTAGNKQLSDQRKNQNIKNTNSSVTDMGDNVERQNTSALTPKHDLNPETNTNEQTTEEGNLPDTSNINLVPDIFKKTPVQELLEDSTHTPANHAATSDFEKLNDGIEEGNGNDTPTHTEAAHMQRITDNNEESPNGTHANVAGKHKVTYHENGDLEDGNIANTNGNPNGQTSNVSSDQSEETVPDEFNEPSEEKSTFGESGSTGLYPYKFDKKVSPYQKNLENDDDSPVTIDVVKLTDTDGDADGVNTKLDIPTSIIKHKLYDTIESDIRPSKQLLENARIQSTFNSTQSAPADIISSDKAEDSSLNDHVSEFDQSIATNPTELNESFTKKNVYPETNTLEAPSSDQKQLEEGDISTDGNAVRKNLIGQSNNITHDNLDDLDHELGMFDHTHTPTTPNPKLHDTIIGTDTAAKQAPHGMEPLLDEVITRTPTSAMTDKDIIHQHVGPSLKDQDVGHNSRKPGSQISVSAFEPDMVSDIGSNEHEGLIIPSDSATKDHISRKPNIPIYTHTPALNNKPYDSIASDIPAMKQFQDDTGVTNAFNSKGSNPTNFIPDVDSPNPHENENIKDQDSSISHKLSKPGTQTTSDITPEDDEFIEIGPVRLNEPAAENMPDTSHVPPKMKNSTKTVSSEQDSSGSPPRDSVNKGLLKPSTNIQNHDLDVATNPPAYIETTTTALGPLVYDATENGMNAHNDGDAEIEEHFLGQLGDADKRDQSNVHASGKSRTQISSTSTSEPDLSIGAGHTKFNRPSAGSTQPSEDLVGFDPDESEKTVQKELEDGSGATGSNAINRDQVTPDDNIAEDDGEGIYNIVDHTHPLTKNPALDKAVTEKGFNRTHVSNANDNKESAASSIDNDTASAFKADKYLLDQHERATSTHAPNHKLFNTITSDIPAMKRPQLLDKAEAQNTFDNRQSSPTVTTDQHLLDEHEDESTYGQNNNIDHTPDKPSSQALSDLASEPDGPIETEPGRYNEPDAEIKVAIPDKSHIRPSPENSIKAVLSDLVQLQDGTPASKSVHAGLLRPSNSIKNDDLYRDNETTESGTTTNTAEVEAHEHSLDQHSKEGFTSDHVKETQSPDQEEGEELEDGSYSSTNNAMPSADKTSKDDFHHNPLTKIPTRDEDILDGRSAAEKSSSKTHISNSYNSEESDIDDDIPAMKQLQLLDKERAPTVIDNKVSSPTRISENANEAAEIKDANLDPGHVHFPPENSMKSVSLGQVRVKDSNLSHAGDSVHAALLRPSLNTQNDHTDGESDVHRRPNTEISNSYNSKESDLDDVNSQAGDAVEADEYVPKGYGTTTEKDQNVAHTSDKPKNQTLTIPNEKPGAVSGSIDTVEVELLKPSISLENDDESDTHRLSSTLNHEQYDTAENGMNARDNDAEAGKYYLDQHEDARIKSEDVADNSGNSRNQTSSASATEPKLSVGISLTKLNKPASSSANSRTSHVGFVPDSFNEELSPDQEQLKDISRDPASDEIQGDLIKSADNAAEDNLNKEQDQSDHPHISTLTKNSTLDEVVADNRIAPEESIEINESKTDVNKESALDGAHAPDAIEADEYFIDRDVTGSTEGQGSPKSDTANHSIQKDLIKPADKTDKDNANGKLDVSDYTDSSKRKLYDTITRDMPATKHPQPFDKEEAPTVIDNSVSSPTNISEKAHKAAERKGANPDIIHIYSAPEDSMKLDSSGQIKLQDSNGDHAGDSVDAELLKPPISVENDDLDRESDTNRHPSTLNPERYHTKENGTNAYDDDAEADKYFLDQHEDEDTRTKSESAVDNAGRSRSQTSSASATELSVGVGLGKFDKPAPSSAHTRTSHVGFIPDRTDEELSPDKEQLEDVRRGPASEGIQRDLIKSADNVAEENLNREQDLSDRPHVSPLTKYSTLDQSVTDNGNAAEESIKRKDSKTDINTESASDSGHTAKSVVADKYFSDGYGSGSTEDKSNPKPDSANNSIQNLTKPTDKTDKDSANGELDVSDYTDSSKRKLYDTIASDVPAMKQLQLDKERAPTVIDNSISSPSKISENAYQDAERSDAKPITTSGQIKVQDSGDHAGDSVHADLLEPSISVENSDLESDTHRHPSILNPVQYDTTENNVNSNEDDVEADEYSSNQHEDATINGQSVADNSGRSRSQTSSASATEPKLSVGIDLTKFNKPTPSSAHSRTSHVDFVPENFNEKLSPDQEQLEDVIRHPGSDGIQRDLIKPTDNVAEDNVNTKKDYVSPLSKNPTPVKDVVDNKNSAEESFGQTKESSAYINNESALDSDSAHAAEAVEANRYFSDRHRIVNTMGQNSPKPGLANNSIHTDLIKTGDIPAKGNISRKLDVSDNTDSTNPKVYDTITSDIPAMEELQRLETSEGTKGFSDRAITNGTIDNKFLDQNENKSTLDDETLEHVADTHILNQHRNGGIKDEYIKTAPGFDTSQTQSSYASTSEPEETDNFQNVTHDELRDDNSDNFANHTVATDIIKSADDSSNDYKRVHKLNSSRTVSDAVASDIPTAKELRDQTRIPSLQNSKKSSATDESRAPENNVESDEDMLDQRRNGYKEDQYSSDKSESQASNSSNVDSDDSIGIKAIGSNELSIGRSSSADTGPVNVVPHHIEEKVLPDQKEQELTGSSTPANHALSVGHAKLIDNNAEDDVSKVHASDIPIANEFLIETQAPRVLNSKASTATDTATAAANESADVSLDETLTSDLPVEQKFAEDTQIPSGSSIKGFASIGAGKEAVNKDTENASLLNEQEIVSRKEQGGIKTEDQISSTFESPASEHKMLKDISSDVANNEPVLLRQNIAKEPTNEKFNESGQHGTTQQSIGLSDDTIKDEFVPNYLVTGIIKDREDIMKQIGEDDKDGSVDRAFEAVTENHLDKDIITENNIEGDTILEQASEVGATEDRDDGDVSPYRKEEGTDKVLPYPAVGAGSNQAYLHHKAGATNGTIQNDEEELLPNLEADNLDKSVTRTKNKKEDTDNNEEQQINEEFTKDPRKEYKKYPLEGSDDRDVNLGPIRLTNEDEAVNRKYTEKVNSKVPDELIDNSREQRKDGGGITEQNLQTPLSSNSLKNKAIGIEKDSAQQLNATNYDPITADEPITKAAGLEHLKTHKNYAGTNPKSLVTNDTGSVLQGFEDIPNDTNEKSMLLDDTSPTEGKISKDFHDSSLGQDDSDDDYADEDKNKNATQSTSSDNSTIKDNVTAVEPSLKRINHLNKDRIEIPKEISIATIGEPKEDNRDYVEESDNNALRSKILTEGGCLPKDSIEEPPTNKLTSHNRIHGASSITKAVVGNGSDDSQGNIDLASNIDTIDKLKIKYENPSKQPEEQFIENPNSNFDDVGSTDAAEPARYKFPLKHEENVLRNPEKPFQNSREGNRVSQHINDVVTKSLAEDEPDTKVSTTNGVTKQGLVDYKNSNLDKFDQNNMVNSDNTSLLRLPDLERQSDNDSVTKIHADSKQLSDVHERNEENENADDNVDIHLNSESTKIDRTNSHSSIDDQLEGGINFVNTTGKEGITKSYDLGTADHAEPEMDLLENGEFKKLDTASSRANTEYEPKSSYSENPNAYTDDKYDSDQYESKTEGRRYKRGIPISKALNIKKWFIKFHDAINLGLLRPNHDKRYDTLSSKYAPDEADHVQPGIGIIQNKVKSNNQYDTRSRLTNADIARNSNPNSDQYESETADYKYERDIPVNGETDAETLSLKEPLIDVGNLGLSRSIRSNDDKRYDTLSSKYIPDEADHIQPGIGIIQNKVNRSKKGSTRSGLTNTDLASKSNSESNLYESETADLKYKRDISVSGESEAETLSFKESLTDVRDLGLSRSIRSNDDKRYDTLSSKYIPYEADHIQPGIGIIQNKVNRSSVAVGRSASTNSDLAEKSKSRGKHYKSETVDSMYKSDISINGGSEAALSNLRESLIDSELNDSGNLEVGSQTPSNGDRRYDTLSSKYIADETDHIQPGIGIIQGKVNRSRTGSRRSGLNNTDEARKFNYKGGQYESETADHKYKSDIPIDEATTVVEPLNSKKSLFEDLPDEPYPETARDEYDISGLSGMYNNPELPPPPLPIRMIENEIDNESIEKDADVMKFLVKGTETEFTELIAKYKPPTDDIKEVDIYNHERKPCKCPRRHPGKVKQVQSEEATAIVSDVLSEDVTTVTQPFVVGVNVDIVRDPELPPPPLPLREIIRGIQDGSFDDPSVTNDNCRKCHLQKETIEHITSACKILAGTEYTARHNAAAKVVHQGLALTNKLTENRDPYYNYTPTSVLENNQYKLYWDVEIHTDKTIPANRPDIVFQSKADKITYLIDIAIPNDNNIQKSYAGKISKYTDLAIEIKRLWKQNKVIIVPLIMSVTGLTPNTFTPHLQQLGLDEKLHKTFQKSRHLMKLLKTKLNSRNLTKAMNTFAILVLTYSFGIIKWSHTDIENIHILIRTELTKHRMSHPNACKERLTIDRKQGGRGIIDIHRHTEPRAITTRKIKTWSLKALHGKHRYRVTQDHINEEQSYTWLQDGQLFPETEGFKLAIQDQVIATRNYKEYVIKDPSMTDDSCRKCHQQKETIEHITSACKALAGTEYTARHNSVAKVIHQALATTNKLIENKDPYYSYTPTSVLENNEYKLYWDVEIRTDKTIPAKRPDIVLQSKADRVTYLIDNAIPNDKNIQDTNAGKISKYTDLALEIKRLWKQSKVIIVP
nr:unnamed protein product [Callosobruchus analis]